jgi:transcriptional regulator with XRE-family HTH domain
VPSPRQLAAARREADRAYRSLREDLIRLRTDAGLSRAALAAGAGLDDGYLARIEDGKAHPSIDVLAKLALALGADLGTHLYPNTGPVIRDRHQAVILEAVLGALHSRWAAYPEVAVRQPSRGWIDAVLHDHVAHVVVAAEIQSDLRRIEQQIRWFEAKANALPSWEGWSLSALSGRRRGY